jgi:acyl-CoA reductase-like NAD-dependent aldehyde dehydrogenase
MPIHYISGKFISGSSKESIQVVDPASEDTIDTVPRGTEQDAEAAVRAAKDAFDSWRRTSANVRAAMMHKQRRR